MGKNTRRKQESAPGWAWMLFGLSIGLAVALVVYLRSAPPLSVSLAARQTPTTTASGVQPEATTAAISDEFLPDVPPVEASSADPASPDAQSGLLFYEKLKESEVVISETALSARAVATPQAYVIQAGSFPAFSGADRMRAELHLLGIESSIEPTIVGDNVYHRVIIGPLSERADINRVMRRLREQRIEPLPPRPVAN